MATDDPPPPYPGFSTGSQPSGAPPPYPGNGTLPSAQPPPVGLPHAASYPTNPPYPPSGSLPNRVPHATSYSADSTSGPQMSRSALSPGLCPRCGVGQMTSQPDMALIMCLIVLAFLFTPLTLCCIPCAFREQCTTCQYAL